MTRAVLVLAFAQIAVGAAAIFARYALLDGTPIGVAAARLSIAALVMLLLAVLRPQPRSARPSAAASRTLAFAGFALAAHFALWIASLEYTSVAISTLLVTTTPIWTALYDAIVCKRPLSRLATAAFIVGGIGLLLVVGIDRTPAPIPGHALLGDALALLGSGAIGAYLLLVREVRAALTTRTIVTRTFSWAALALVVASLIAHQPAPPLHAASAWAGILAMAFISQLLGHTAINASLRHFTPNAVSFATLLEPVIAGALALAIFGEPIPAFALLGGALLLGAIGVVLREERVDLSAVENL